MVEIEVTYTGELHTTAHHGPSGADLDTDAPRDNEGRGASFSPTDLVATALGTCILTTMDLYARRHGVKLAGARARVEKHMVATPRRRIGRLPVTITMPSGVPKEARPTLENIALHCPVHLSVNPDIERPMTFVYPD